MHSFGTVRGQDAAVLTHAARDRQPRLVPHGFSEGELRKQGEKRQRTQEEERDEAKTQDR